MHRPILAATVIFTAALSLGAGLALQPPTHSAPAAASPSSLRICGTGLKNLSLSLADLKSMPRRSVSVSEKDGKKVTYDGVTVEHLLTRAGMSFGQALRGPRLRDFLLAEARDGYAVIYALPEISTEFSDRLILVADSADGQPLSERDGPLKIIVSDEKKHARWVRNVTSLTVRTCEPEKPPTDAKPAPRDR